MPLNQHLKCDRISSQSAFINADWRFPIASSSANKKPRARRDCAQIRVALPLSVTTVHSVVRQSSCTVTRGSSARQVLRCVLATLLTSGNVRLHVARRLSGGNLREFNRPQRATREGDRRLTGLARVQFSWRASRTGIQVALQFWHETRLNEPGTGPVGFPKR